MLKLRERLIEIEAGSDFSLEFLLAFLESRKFDSSVAFLGVSVMEMKNENPVKYEKLIRQIKFPQNITLFSCMYFKIKVSQIMKYFNKFLSWNNYVQLLVKKQLSQSRGLQIKKIVFSFISRNVSLSVNRLLICIRGHSIITWTR